METLNTEHIKIETKLPVVSYSKVNTYKTCPKSYKYCYIDKLPRKEKPYTIFGQYCHKILQNFHEIYLNGSTAEFEDSMKKAFIDAKNEWEEKLTKEQIQEAFEIMQSYLNIFALQEHPPIILNVEKKIWLDIDGEFIFYGFIDRVQRDSDGILQVVDYKTTKDAKYLKDRTQLLLYAYSLYVENKDINKIRTSYIMLKHNNDSLVAEHAIDELIQTKDKLIETWNIIKEDKLFRAKPNFLCKMCDNLDVCNEGKAFVNKKPTFGQLDW